MSVLSITPDIVAGASENLGKLGSALRGANAEAASRITAIAAPAADEVSAAVTTAFGTHGQEFQALGAKAAVFHDEFVSLLNGGAAQYASTELASAQQTLANAVNTPAQALLGHPLLGTGGAANPAETTPSNPGTYSQNYGPFQFSLSQTATGVNGTVTLNTPFGAVGSFLVDATPVNYGGDVAGFTLKATGNLNTPFGPLSWFSQNGSIGFAPDGTFWGAISGQSTLGTEGASVTGTIAGGTVQITGGSLTRYGLTLWVEGTQFGLVPAYQNPLGFGI